MTSLLLELENVPSPLGFDSWLTFWLILVVSVLNGILMLFSGYKFLQIIQLSGYKLKGYWQWIKDTKASYWWRLVALSLLSSAALLMTNVLLEQFLVYKILTYAGLLFYFLFSIIFIINLYSAPQKTPLKYTKRMSRLCTVVVLLVVALTFFIMTASSLYIPFFDFGIVGLTPMLLPLIIVLAYYIMLPIEMLISRGYIVKAKRIIDLHEDLIVVGITGSYGKTSVKNILNSMLSMKYNVCATPYSYNTPLGLAKTILNNLKKGDKIFIAEMGAKYVGDIKYLAQMVKPDMAVVTGIGNQHLATFGSKENLVKTKYELVENVSENGKVFVNTDSAGAKQIFDWANKTKFSLSLENDNGDYVSDISVSSRGSKFVLHIGKEQVSCETVLLGKHNISNILLCAKVAHELGVGLEDIKIAISKLVPSAHRLAIVPSSNALVVIDDAYNGSVEGSTAALEVLKEFAGKKIVITPGLVELGADEYNSNFEFGKKMAGVCDYVIINGVVNYEPIAKGLEDGGFNKEKILRAGSLKQAIELLNGFAEAGDVVLFENDLPDNYN